MDAETTTQEANQEAAPDIAQAAQAVEAVAPAQTFDAHVVERMIAAAVQQAVAPFAQQRAAAPQAAPVDTRAADIQAYAAELVEHGVGEALAIRLATRDADIRANAEAIAEKKWQQSQASSFQAQVEADYGKATAMDWRLSDRPQNHPDMAQQLQNIAAAYPNELPTQHLARLHSFNPPPQAPAGIGARVVQLPTSPNARPVSAAYGQPATSAAPPPVANEDPTALGQVEKAYNYGIQNGAGRTDAERLSLRNRCREQYGLPALKVSA